MGQAAATNNISQRAIRNRRYKLVQTEEQNCTGGLSTLVDELYEISDSRVVPKIDYAEKNLLKSGTSALTKLQQKNYNQLVKELQNLEKSIVACPGDGNLDLVVNQKDIADWEIFSATSGTTTQNGGGKSSWFDFNLDGLTDTADRQIILDNLGNKCK